jgi:hypothetical protein
MKPKQDDPAAQGSELKSNYSLPMYYGCPAMHSKLLMKKFDNCVDKGLIEASYAKSL